MYADLDAIYPAKANLHAPQVTERSWHEGGPHESLRANETNNGDATRSRSAGHCSGAQLSARRRAGQPEHDEWCLFGLPRG